MKDSQTFWDQSAPRYARSPIRDEHSYQKKLAVTQQYLRPDWSVLEFGCGTGSTAMIHAPYVREILATDISPKMLEIAERKVVEQGIRNIRFQQGSLDSLALDDASFDAVLGLNILHLLTDVESAIVRVSQLLRPGGVFVSSTALVGDMGVLWRMLIPLMQGLGFAPHVSKLRRSDLVALLSSAGFAIEYEWQPASTSVFIVARKPLL